MYYETDVNYARLPLSPLRIIWEREFYPAEHIGLGYALKTGRELLIFEGEAHVIDALKALTEGFRVPEPPEKQPPTTGA